MSSADSLGSEQRSRNLPSRLVSGAMVLLSMRSSPAQNPFPRTSQPPDPGDVELALPTAPDRREEYSTFVRNTFATWSHSLWGQLQMADRLAAGHRARRALH